MLRSKELGGARAAAETIGVLLKRGFAALDNSVNQQSPWVLEVIDLDPVPLAPLESVTSTRIV
jgi:hypothetical protein